VQSVTLQPDLLMPILAQPAGQQHSGLIVDIGSTETRCLGVLYGRPIFNSLTVGSVGVMHAIEIFAEHLSGHLSVAVDLTAAKKMFEKFACYGTHLPKELQSSQNTGLFDVPSDVATGGVQMLLDSIAETVLLCLKTTGIDARKQLLKNVVVCGGGGCISGIAEGVCASVRDLAAVDERFGDIGQCIKASNNGRESDVIALVCPDFGRTGLRRDQLAWIGGSVFGVVSKNTRRFITQSEAVARFSLTEDAAPCNRVTGSSVALARHACTATIRAPDWMSIAEHDWAFVSPRHVRSSRSQKHHL
jgi:hypothetical protein